MLRRHVTPTRSTRTCLRCPALQLRAALQGWGLNQSAVLSVEDLSAYEYDETLLPRSVQAWCQYLKSLGVDPDQAKVAAFLQDRGLAGLTMSHQRSKIANFHAVMLALRATGDPDLIAMLRP